MKTYWNGEETPARRVAVVVGPAEKPSFWHAGLEGTVRAAVEVTYGGARFLLDDEDGSGWAKVTTGHGSPRYGHRGLPNGSVIL